RKRIMAWKYRYVELPVVFLGALAIAHCSSGAATGPAAECSSWKQNPDGSRTCLDNPASTATATTGAGMTSTTGIPPIDTTASASTTGIAVLDTTVSATSAGAVTTSAGPSTTGGNGGASAVTTDAGVGGASTITTDAGAQATATTGGGTTLGTLRVSAGSYSRDHSIVSFPYPDGAGKALSLTDSAGVEIPLQYSSTTGKATFILASLAAGATADYTINQRAEALPAGVTVTEEADTTGNQLFVRMGEKKVFRWTLVEDNFRGAQSRDVRAGYIYPIYTPGGLNVGDDYQADHPHMHGIWSAWTLTTFNGHKVDFWNGYDNSGRVDLSGMKGIWNGPVTGGLVASLVHSDITTNPSTAALNEEWIVTVYKTHDGDAPYFIYDIDSTQTTASSSPLILETYHYGGFGYRGSEQWLDVNKVSYLSSEGHTRTTGDGQRAKWLAQYGTVDGMQGGYAAFDHPTNFRHPQGLRIHPTYPYWSFTACTDSAGGRFEITEAAPYKSLYRVVAFDGDADAALLNQLYNDFGEPPTVEILP
ncbi:MAG TPA: DUF6807 family protein, partial [Polyangiaceae bacterium]|nr:DUF6807 family protein [Polyangiaceae bacterium]